MTNQAHPMLVNCIHLARRHAADIVAAAVLIPLASAAHAGIVFEAKVAGPVSNIYSVDSSGTLNKLTDNMRWRDMDTDVSADGRVAFISNRRNQSPARGREPRRDFNIYIIEPQDRGIRQMTDSSAREVSPRLSPDGGRLAYIRQFKNRQELVVTDLGDDSAKPRVLDIADSIFGLSWSPDGEELCFAPVKDGVSSLVTTDTRNGGMKTLSTVSTQKTDGKSPPAQYVSTSWSPDGANIAYIHHPLEEGVRQLRVIGADGKNDRPVSGEKAQVQNTPVWSEDGDRILYSALVDYKFYYDETEYEKVYEGGMHIFLSNIDEGTSRQLTEGDFLFKRPVFSPDGERIAFLYANRLNARTLSLKTMKIDGSDAKTLFDSVAQRSQLHWH